MGLDGTLKKAEEEFLFFWNGPFSQWSMDGAGPIEQFYCDGIPYNCAEQWMMARKAQLFGDVEVFQKIMDSVDPREQKALGRQVKNFDEETWNHYAKQIVFEGSVLKFTQHHKYKAALMATEGFTLVEASPYDKIWGIGLGEDDPRALKRETWEGKNWLGEILTEVRDRILQYEAH